VPRITALHMLRSIMKTISAPASSSFRGSLPHPTQPLCTLRVRRRRCLTQHSLPGGLLDLTWVGLAPTDRASFAGAFPHSMTSSASGRGLEGRQALAVLQNRLVGLLYRNVLIYVKTRLLGSLRQFFVSKKQDVSKVPVSLQSGNPEALMSALCQKRTLTLTRRKVVKSGKSNLDEFPVLPKGDHCGLRLSSGK